MNYKKNKKQNTNVQAECEVCAGRAPLVSLQREERKKEGKREKMGENYIPKSMYLGSHPNRLFQVDRKNIQGSSEQ